MRPTSPLDAYTPHGYLDNPYHTRNLNPSGIIRSTPGIGFGWHYPALTRGYGSREVYRAALNLAMTVDGVTHFRQTDFVNLYADVHSKNIFRYVWEHGDIELRTTFWRVGEHALALQAEVRAERAKTVRLTVFTPYTRHLGAAGTWGESGLVGRLHEGLTLVQGFEDGEAFALGSDKVPAAAGVASALSSDFLGDPTMPGDHVVVTGRKGDSVTLYGAAAYDLEVSATGYARLDAVLSRAKRRDLAATAHKKAMAGCTAELSVLRSEDSDFWSRAPTLEGDWPESWRRGFVTDLETLRMMVRRPVGIYNHPWDAMQIQAPRVVLAEASIDAMLLGYADLGTAKDMLLGTFLDAPAPNVPCSREDGSYNMVGANGSECGTAPEWGYPTEVTAFLFDLDEDDAWLAAVYPRLKGLLEWWLEHRTDVEGYLVYDNSWESGQDLSARFGPQKAGGGSTIRMVRPVDLQAAMAKSCQTMARFANVLGRLAEQDIWLRRADIYNNFTQGLWHEGAYRDYDARVGWSDVWDVMQLAPVALGLSSPEQNQKLRPKVRQLAEDAYLWPMFVWTAVDAALQVGERDVAGEIASGTIDRAYGYWDSRDFTVEGRLPGVTCEYWGEDGQCGAEGYGWGAFGVHLLLHVLMGFRPQVGGFSLTPNLPRSWLTQANRRYSVRNLWVSGTPVDLNYVVTSDGLDIGVTSRGRELRLGQEQGFTIQVQAPTGGICVFEVVSGGPSGRHSTHGAARF